MAKIAAVAASARRAALSLLLVAPGLRGQVAHLDDPQRSVFKAFPAADAYRVIVREIGTDARCRIEKLLPFRVHYDELGTHSLYVALLGRRPIGMLYVQYEESSYGLTAIELALTFDLRFSGFRFQRERSRSRVRFEQSEFARLLTGRTRSEFEALIDGHGNLLPDIEGVPSGTEELAGAVVRSTIKAFAVLESCWRTDIDGLRDRSLGMRTFPAARRFEHLWPASSVPARQNPKRDPSAVDAHSVVDQPAESREQKPDLVWAVRAHGSEDRVLGVAAELRVAEADAHAAVLVIFDRDGIVRSIETDPALCPRLRARCGAIRNRPLGELTGESGLLGRGLRRLHRALSVPSQPGR